MGTVKIVRAWRMTAVQLVASIIALDAQAASIAIDSVVQRWPWNNKVDIAYTVTGGQDVSAGVYARIEFTATIAGTAYAIDGQAIAADASDGSHVATWTAPAGLRASGCTMTARLLSSDAPSGNDYMIIDLDTGAIAYEGLGITQAASSARYNTASYKDAKLVLRKISAGGPYPTGDDANYSSVNSARTWTTARDYYVGVFPVTQAQYTRICGVNPSEKTGAGTGDMVAHRPVEKVSWDMLRGGSAISPTQTIASVTSDKGTFFQRLNFKTGLYFDLPTEVMCEIAERAGSTNIYYWGDAMDESYVVCKENRNFPVAVGTYLPNAWGLYDTAGNVWEWCRDDSEALSNLANAPDPFTPAYGTGAKRRLRGGGAWYTAKTADSFRASDRGLSLSSGYAANNTGFRVSLTVE